MAKYVTTVYRTQFILWTRAYKENTLINTAATHKERSILAVEISIQLLACHKQLSELVRQVRADLDCRTCWHLTRSGSPNGPAADTRVIGLLAKSKP